MTSPYTEEDREKEKREALTVAPTVPAVNNEIWSFVINRPGLTKDSLPIYLCTVKIHPVDTILNFESFSPSPPSQDDLYSVLCRAIAFPMSRKEPNKPSELRLTVDHGCFNDAIESPTLFARRVSTELGVRVVIGKGGGSTGPNRKELEYACHACRKILGADKVLRCSACRGINYCGRDCQSSDWKTHKSKCKVIKGAMERTKDLADDAGLDVINTQDLPERLEQDRLLGRGLWRVDIVEGTFDLDSRMDGTTKDPLDSCEGLPPQFCPLASPLTKGSGFDNTPTAISSWRDYYKAKSMDIAFPAPLLMSNALTLFHAISHLFPRPSSQSSSPRPMSFAPGSHICIHIIQATQSQVELAPYYQLLAPLFPYVTIDIFLIGPGVVVVPLASGMNVKGPLDTPTVLAKRDHSIEYKAEAFGSCIRVHFARARYEEFPRSNYPPHIIVCQDAAARLFLRPEGEEGQTVGEEDLKAAEATVAAVFRMEGVRVLFAESTELDAAIVRERIRVRGGKSSSVEVGVNPFRQTLRRHMPTLRIPAYLNGYLVTCVV